MGSRIDITTRTNKDKENRNLWNRKYKLYWCYNTYYSDSEEGWDGDDTMKHDKNVTQQITTTKRNGPKW